MSCNEIIQFLLKLTPSSKPRLWVIINLSILLYSVVVLCLLAFTHEGSNKYDRFVREWYLTYDVIVCIVWLLETTLVMVTTHFKTSNTPVEREFPLSKVHIIEWLFALFFVHDSISRSLKKIRGKDHTTEMGLDVTINAIAYAYALYVQYNEYIDKTKQGFTELPDDEEEQ